MVQNNATQNNTTLSQNTRKIQVDSCLFGANRDKTRADISGYLTSLF